MRDTAPVTSSPVWCWLNGTIAPAATTSISVTDHGLTVGDGVFETMKVVDGEPFAVTRHLRRLHRSAAGLDLDLDGCATDERISDGCRALIAAARARERATTFSA